MSRDQRKAGRSSGTHPPRRHPGDKRRPPSDEAAFDEEPAEDGQDAEPAPGPRPAPRRRGSIFPHLIVLFLLVIGAAGYVWSLFVAEGPLPVETVVVIQRGDSVDAIAERLAEAGVIEDVWLFRVAARIENRRAHLKAGEFSFPPAVSQQHAIRILQQGSVLVRRFTVAEGLTSHEAMQIINAAAGLTGAITIRPPEGSLMPETYHYSRGDTRKGVVERMQEAMNETLDRLWAGRAAELPFSTKEEALILASIVEKETALASERPRVAAVFINRLRRKMRLQSDPTVIYAVSGGTGALGRPLTKTDLATDSPYNTYKVSGLPPGPICNPGRASLAAVLNPIETKDLYFVADGTGGHAFAQTLDEHNKNVARWRRIEKQQRGN